MNKFIAECVGCLYRGNGTRGYYLRGEFMDEGMEISIDEQTACTFRCQGMQVCPLSDSWPEELK